MPPSSLSKIYRALMDFSAAQNPAFLFPTMVPEAASLIVTDPYAFAIATCLDRGTKVEIIWTIPYYIKNHLGHLDPFKIHRMSLEELAEMFRQLPHRPRFVNDAPRTLKELTNIVVGECEGDTSKIWMDKHAAAVKRTFQSIHGVGEGIANMAVLLIEAGLPGSFS